MATAPSSLSVAIQGVADWLDGLLDEDVVVTVDSPQKAQEQAKTASNDILNLFVYRLAPSGIHPDATADEPFFVRAHVLLTAFPRGQGTDAPSDIDLRVLGQALRILSSTPVIPLTLPGAASGEAGDFRTGPTSAYRLQAVMQAPGMEELNHIWTTQGGELAYRLSLAYELALIPIEPLTHAETAPPAVTGLIEVNPSVPAEPPAGFSAYTGTPIARPLGGVPQGTELLSDFVPVLLWPTGTGLTNQRRAAPGTASLPVALAGPLGARIAVSVGWTRSGGAAATQADQLFDVSAQNIDDEAGHVTVALESAASGDVAIVTAFPALQSGDRVPGTPPSNALTLTVE